MKKDYSKWSVQKEGINSIETRPLFQQRDIWFCAIGCNIGYEEDGAGDDFIRPIVVVCKINSNMCWVVPLTRTSKANQFYFKLSVFSEGFSMAILSQLRIVDAKRLSRKIGFVPQDVFLEMQERLKRFLS
ncbi:MAG: type II toxin-antitoxin system PemK/MazF family toxin [Patescibacteria group bacterium]